MKLQITNFGFAVLACVLFWVLVIGGVMLLSGCGGTFTLMPDGTISYTTRAIIVPQK